MQDASKIFLLLVLCLAGAFTGRSQGLTNNGNLRIHAGGTLSSSVGFTNASTGTLVNEGSIYLRADLTNHESGMSAGSGTLYFTGSGAQLVTGTATMKTHHLVTNNNAGITLQNDLSVAGTHTFTTGLIHSSATPHYLIYENGAGHSGSSDAGHVTGWVRKNGTGNFTFPVGDNSYLRTIGISNLSVSAVFNAHYYTNTADVYNMQSPLVKVRAAEFWQLDKVSGGSAQVTMSWDHSKVPMDNILLADIRAGHYYGGQWINEGGSATGDVATTGSVTSNAITNFSPFTLAYISFPIPLKLVSFTGWRKTGKTFLHWISENEQDMLHFSVERSLDGVSFAAIGQVPARNAGIRELYNYQDPFSFTGTIYYRLKNVDNDGTFTYSRIISVSENNIPGSSIAVVNPVQTAITVLNKTAPGGEYAYQLYNAGGQMIQSGQLILAPNSASLIRLSLHMVPGIYSLRLMKEQLVYEQRVLVER